MGKKGITIIEESSFDTMELLYAVDHLDSARTYISDQEFLKPPQLRFNLMDLHEKAVSVHNYGKIENKKEMLELAWDIEIDLTEAIDSLKKARKTVRKLIDTTDLTDLED